MNNTALNPLNLTQPDRLKYFFDTVIQNMTIEKVIQNGAESLFYVAGAINKYLPDTNGFTYSYEFSIQKSICEHTNGIVYDTELVLLCHTTGKTNYAIVDVEDDINLDLEYFVEDKAEQVEDTKYRFENRIECPAEYVYREFKNRYDIKKMVEMTDKGIKFDNSILRIKF